MINKIILSFGLLCCMSVQTNAQKVEKQFLEVEYESVIKMDEDFSEYAKYMPADQIQELKEIMKAGVSATYYLNTDGNKSSYKLEEKIVNDPGMLGMIKAQIANSDKGMLYKNFADNYYNKKYDVVGTKYLITDSLPDFNWVVSRRKEKIAGYTVQKATGVLNDSINYTAWFAPKIAIKDGPDRSCGLPGLILRLKFDYEKYQIDITAKNIKTIEPKTLEAPKGGKVLTTSEFEAEMKAFREKMKKMYGGN